jgi:hypothetical protein
VEVEVLDRVVLGMDSEPILARVLGDAARQREREQDPVVLEAKIPVEPAGVVLVDDEPPLVARSSLLRARLRSSVEIAL